MKEVFIRTHDIVKEFSSVRVLDGISVDIRAGEVLGIIGENGAGKSTFIKILSGIYTPTSGRIEVEGKSVRISGPADARKVGVGLVPQEFNLVADLKVYENIFLGEELKKKNGFLDRAAMIARTRELLAGLEAGSIDPESRIQDLSVAQKQMIEIAKAIAFDSRLLILDEPTTVLTSKEIEVLFGLMERLKARGVTLVYISHKLREVKRICDRVMVLRDGKLICVEENAVLDTAEMARRMVGRELSQIFPPRNTAGQTGPVLLEVSGLTVPGLVSDISFSIHSGEILGFAGLIGAGRTEIAETILGLHRPSSGTMRLKGKTHAPSAPADAVASGISYLSEDRQGSGILTAFDLVGNTTLVSLKKYGKFFIDSKKEQERTQFYVDAFRVKSASLATRLEFLSGGNQQKISLAKSLDTGPELLIVDEPTRGVDINAKHDIYAFIRELADKGMAVMFVSSELEEIIGMCTRVIVMKEGKIAGTLQGGAINEEEIMYFATGIKGGLS